MNTCDTAGNYGDTPRSNTCTVYTPITETLENSWAWDYSTGSHSNTEQDESDPESDNALKCSHTSEVLTGTWTSVEYDLGSVKDVRIEGDFLTYFTAGTATWGNTLSTKTWADWGALS